MLFQVCLILVVTLLVVLRWQKRDLYKLYNELPKVSKKCWPIIGHAYVVSGSDEDRMKTVQDFGREAIKCNGMVAFWFGPKFYIVVADAEIAEFLMRTCLEKDDIMRISRKFTGNGSIFAPVSIWRPRRKILSANFKPKNLHQFVRVFYEQSNVLVKQLRPKVGKGAFSVWKYVTTYTFDAICETNLGTKIQSQQNPDHPFLAAFDTICKLDNERMCKPWLHIDAINNILPRYEQYENSKKVTYSFMDKIIKAKREELNNRKNAADNEKDGETKMKTFLEMLIESSGGEQGYTDQELREETLVITVAGTDTSAVGVAFLLVMLARLPDVQQKVYEELREVFGDFTKAILAEDLTRLKYLDAVVKETLRLYPPVPVVTRKVVNYVKLPSGVTLVPGTGVLMDIWAIHRNPRYWGDDAEHFKPERFLNGAPNHPGAFMAFSYTPRNCVGYQYAMLSIKTVCTTVLRNYKILPAKENTTCNGNAATDEDAEPLKVKWNIMMKDVNDFMIRLEPREPVA